MLRVFIGHLELDRSIKVLGQFSFKLEVLYNLPIGLFSSDVTALITEHSDPQYTAEALVLFLCISNLTWENMQILME